MYAVKRTPLFAFVEGQQSFFASSTRVVGSHVTGYLCTWLATGQRNKMVLCTHLGGSLSAARFVKWISTARLSF